MAFRSYTAKLKLWIAALGLVGALGCRDETAPSQTPAATAPRVEEMAHGETEVTFTIDPPRVDYARDTLLTIEMSAPTGVRIALPPLDSRMQGFILGGTFEDPAVVEGQRITRRLNARLTPLPGHEHRIAPMAIRVNDNRATPPVPTWFPSHPILLEVIPPATVSAAADISDKLEPVWIRPPFKEVATYVLIALAVVALVFLLWKLAGRLHRQVKLMRMSPRERALKELAILLAKDLVARHKVKEFYLQLTMIVRRYIERAHKVRAPEQTTEEFLTAVADDPQFSHEVMQRLSAFLQAADLVKFAAYNPSDADVDRATRTARSYIEQDAAATETEAQ